jgi:hypothetical protein
MPQAAAPAGSGNQYEASRYASVALAGVRCADARKHEHCRQTRFDEPQPARRDRDLREHLGGHEGEQHEQRPRIRPILTPLRRRRRERDEIGRFRAAVWNQLTIGFG